MIAPPAPPTPASPCVAMPAQLAMLTPKSTSYTPALIFSRR